MKRTATSIAISALFLVPALASAASIQLTPSSVNVVAGQTFTVTVTATPSGAPLYTASANMQFSPSIVSETGFSLAPTWIAVTQSGYDLVDNTNGSFIKTGGYPAGFNAPTVLGTITFRAKQAGTATITVDGNSVLLDGGSNNQLSGAQGSVTVNVANAPAAPASTQGTAEASVPNNSAVSGTTTSSTGSSATTLAGQAAAAATAVATSSQAAAVGEIFKGVPMWVWWTLLALIVLGALYAAWRYYAKRA